MTNSKAIIKEIILNGSVEEKKLLYGFDQDTPRKVIAKKFKLFSRGCYPRYFSKPSAPFHDDFISDMINSYFGENRLNAAYRGSAKTSLKKLFDVFVLLNDGSAYRKYLKVLSRDLANSKQIVTDVYNLIIEVRGIYGDVFESETDAKREETMSSFTTADGRKYKAGTVGQSQRGHLQDAYRPDWVWFEDTEDRVSIDSVAITQGTINRCEEAIDGLAKGGSYYVTCNYISDQGVVQYFMDKPSVKTRITPMLLDSKDDTSTSWPIYSTDEIAAIRADCEDWWGEYQCLRPNTLICTDKGLKTIDSLKINDLVWTHKGRLKRVIRVFENQGADLLDITVQDRVTTVTKNHPVLVIRDGKETWTAAGELILTDLLLKIPRGKLIA